MSVLSRNVTAEYSMLIKGHIDRLPVTKIKHFEKVVESLKSLLYPDAGYIISKKLQSRISRIKELIDDPDNIYYLPDHKDQIKQVFLLQISQKIDKFVQFADEEKLAYISNQEEERALAYQQQAEMKKRSPPKPGTPAHSLSEEQWHLETQLQLQKSEIELQDSIKTIREEMGKLQDERSAVKASIHALQWEIYCLEVRMVENQALPSNSSCIADEAIIRSKKDRLDVLTVIAERKELQILLVERTLAVLAPYS